jgi:hypothetical protein
MSIFSLRCAALAILAAGALSAADSGALPYGVECKLRYGYGLTDPDRLSGGLMGFSAGGFLAAGAGRITAELGYQWKSGSQFLEPAGPAQTGKLAPDYGADSRRNSLSGITLRLGYAHPVLEDLYVQGGIQAGGARFKHEYVGEWQATTGGYDDTFNGTPTKASSPISPFLGVRYDVSRDMGLELNLVAQGYTAIAFHHTPGAPIASGTVDSPSHVVYQGDGLTEAKRTVMHVEIAYVFRF